MMANVKIYTKNYCPYCVHAKNLLQNKGVSFTEENLEDNPEEMMALIQKTGMRTVPQIFINDELIGGFTELSALEQAGELDKKLAQ
ncbi:MAG: glutaredoxin 3 [Bdellovibrionota bacterium]|nr:glutaredoxin 3 [Pseudobdellovibrionaceae bacterium]